MRRVKEQWHIWIEYLWKKEDIKGVKEGKCLPLERNIFHLTQCKQSGHFTRATVYKARPTQMLVNEQFIYREKGQRWEVYCVTKNILRMKKSQKPVGNDPLWWQRLTVLLKITRLLWQLVRTGSRIELYVLRRRPYGFFDTWRWFQGS